MLHLYLTFDYIFFYYISCFPFYSPETWTSAMVVETNTYSLCVPKKNSRWDVKHGEWLYSHSQVFKYQRWDGAQPKAPTKREELTCPICFETNGPLACRMTQTYIENEAVSR